MSAACRRSTSTSEAAESERQQAVRAEQNHAGRTIAGESENRAEVEIVGQQDESVPPRSLEDLSVGSRAITDLASVAGFDARVRQRLDPPRRQVHVDQELQLEPTVTSCSSLRHTASSRTASSGTSERGSTLSTSSGAVDGLPGVHE